jgi:hypothetical protein
MLRRMNDQYYVVGPCALMQTTCDVGYLVQFHLGGDRVQNTQKITFQEQNSMFHIYKAKVQRMCVPKTIGGKSVLPPQNCPKIHVHADRHGTSLRTVAVFTRSKCTSTYVVSLAHFCPQHFCCKSLINLLSGLTVSNVFKLATGQKSNPSAQD